MAMDEEVRWKAGGWVFWTTSCHDIRAFLELDMKYRQFTQFINQILLYPLAKSSPSHYIAKRKKNTTTN